MSVLFQLNPITRHNSHGLADGEKHSDNSPTQNNYLWRTLHFSVALIYRGYREARNRGSST